jgi:hypothetical protein
VIECFYLKCRCHFKNAQLSRGYKLTPRTGESDLKDIFLSRNGGEKRSEKYSVAS